MTPTATEVRERPVIFSATMIRAFLAGRKTQTRRLKGLEDVNGYDGRLDGEGSLGPLGYRGLCESDLYIRDKADYRRNPGLYHWFYGERPGAINPIPVRCPYGAPGGQLIVRESVWTHPANPFNRLGTGRHFYDADLNDEQRKERRAQGWRKRPSIHMHRGFSRLTLEIDAVRVERAHSITDADVRAEGVDPAQIEKWRKWLDPRDVHGMAYGELFDSVNGKGAWAKNPWLWVLSSHRVESPARAAEGSSARA